MKLLLERWNRFLTEEDDDVGQVIKIIKHIEKQTGLDVSHEASSSNFRIELFKNKKLVGYFRTSTISRNSHETENMPSDCKDAWDNLGEPDLWVIRSAEWFDEELRGKGYGKLLYNALFSYIASLNGVVGPDKCSGGSTSDDAKRVWASLYKKYPSEGPLIDLRKQNIEERLMLPKLYHYSEAAFDRFTLDKASRSAVWGPGIYLTDDPSGIEGWGKTRSGGGYIYEVRVSASPAQIIDGTSPFPKGSPEPERLYGKLEKYIGRSLPTSLKENRVLPFISLERNFGSVSEGLRKLGYVVFIHQPPGGHLGKHYVVTDPAKVRILHRARVGSSILHSLGRKNNETNT